MIIVDTGFWVALFNDKDQYHQSAQQTLAKYSSEPLITTWCVLTESCHLLLHGRILSIDNRDFNTYRWKNKKPFINLFQIN
jgi:predicted nucleic acid-binding protein